jgi:signal transduction histidine kinase
MMSEDERRRLTDLLIHDLVGPLSVLSTTVSSLLYKADRYGPITDRQKKALERILRNSRKAQTLIQEMLEISRSEEGVFQKDHFPIKRVLQESLLDALEVTLPEAAEKFFHVEDEKEFQSLLEAHGIFIETRGKYNHSLFCHDQRKIQQILRNLISNALKYRRERLTLCVSGEQDLIVSVEDDGIGIPPGDQQIIFKRFVRLKDPRCIDLPGLGLGLAGVTALVDAMGGEITLVSREGVGTCFTVQIPPL